jgi:hypothetical protein
MGGVRWLTIMETLSPVTSMVKWFKVVVLFAVVLTGVLMALLLRVVVKWVVAAFLLRVVITGLLWRCCSE